ncbi:hypothetical protein KEM52_005115 [Ascosphaera acerosa]|nr:hypothetical protein KEM52_005115 [Ascosphaera acerosa]
MTLPPRRTNRPLPRRTSAAALGAERLEVQARKFYSQRNMYLCGFTLFLSLILDRTTNYIRDILHLEMRLRQATGSSAGAGKATKGQSAATAGTLSASAASSADEYVAEIARLKKELALKEKDIEAMKAQSAGLAREYERLGDEFGKKEGAAAGGAARKDL